MQSSIVNGGSGAGKRWMRVFPSSLERSVVFGTIGMENELLYCDQFAYSPTPATPADWYVTAKHLFPAGTGAKATKAVSRFLGRPLL